MIKEATKRLCMAACCMFAFCPCVVVAQETKTEDGADDTDLFGLNATYEVAGLWLGVGYERHGRMLTGADTDDDGAVDVGSAEEEYGLRIVGSYTWRGLRVVGLYEALSDLGGVAGADRDSWGGGLAYTLGRTTVKGGYYGTDGIDGAPDAGTNMLAVAVDHAFTNRTTLYGAFAVTDNASASALTMTGAGHGANVFPAPGEEPYGVAVGLNHAF